jgi:ribosomal protein L19E
MPIAISIKIDARQLQRQLTNIAQRQVPFAISQAINAIAAKVVTEETAALTSTFDQPRAFTTKAFTQGSSFGGQFASKRNPIAVIVAKPIQEAYLAPSEFDEPQSLGQGKRIRTPVNIRTGTGGNISKNEIRKLMAQPDVFIGVVRGINGIWRRPATGKRRAGARGTKGKHRGTVGGKRTTLQLLVAFTRPVNVKTDLKYFERAEQIVTKSWNVEFDRAIRRALATAR